MRRAFGLPDRTALPVVLGGRRGLGSRRFLVAAAAESSSDPEMAKQLTQWDQAPMTASYSGDDGQFSSGRGGFSPSASLETAAAQQWAVASSRRPETGVPASHRVEVDESGKERVSYHQRLVVAAQQGSPQVAEDVIDAMNGNGIPAGPRAYHGLVFSYVKAGDPEGALDAIKREYHSGVWPLPESYMVLIHGFVKAGDVTRAEAVFKSMRARMNAQPGWQVLTTALFEQGFAAQALDHLQRGREEGWKLNSKLYELQIRALAEMGEKERAQAELMRMREEGLKPEPCHVNPVIRVQAMGGAVEAAEVMVNDMMYATGPMPDIGTFNALLEGIVHDPTQDVRSKMSLTVGMMGNARVKPNEITHMLMLDGALREDRMAAAQEAYANLLSAVGVGTTRIIPDDLLAKYIGALVKAGYPKQVVQLLQQVKKDKRSSLEGLCRPLDSDGRTFITSWLLAASQRNRSLRMRAADGTDQPFTAASDDDSVRIVDGVRIGIGNCVVDEEGNVVSASKLRVRELRAELEARGLSSEGKRDRLYSRLRASRASIKGLLEGLKKGTDKSRNKARNTLRQARGFLQNASIEANCSGETVKQVLGRELKEERLRRLQEAGSSGSSATAGSGSRKRKPKHQQLIAIVDGKEVTIADPQAEKLADDKEPDLDELEEEEPPPGIKGELEEGGGEEDAEEEDAESMLEELELEEGEEGNEAAGREGGEDEDVVAPDAEMASPENALPDIDARDVESDGTNMWQVDVDERETYDSETYEDSGRNDLTRIVQLARANVPSSHTSEQKKLLELLGQDDDEDSDSMPLQSSLTMLRMASSLGMAPTTADFRTLLRTAEVECRLDAVSLIIQALLKEVRAKAVEAQAAASAQHDEDGEEEEALRPAAGGADDADGTAALDVGRWIGEEAQQMVVDLANEAVRVCLDQNKLYIARNIIDSVREETELTLDPQLVASVELSIRQQGAAQQSLGDEEMAGIDRLDAALDEASVPGAAAN